MQVELLKKNSTYIKDGEERTAINFYVKLNDVTVPIQVRYFEDKETGEDKQYSKRKALLSAFATTLPDVESEKKTD